MNVILPYHDGDAQLALKLLGWIKQLGNVRRHRIFLMADNNVNDDVVRQIHRAASCFKSTKQIYTPFRIRGTLDGKCEWPWGPNWAFYNAANFMAMSESDPWLWLEPDCVPLTKDWLDALESEYRESHSLFMGHVHDLTKLNLDGYPASYMNGTAIYPAKAARYCFDGYLSFLRGRKVAFDIALSPAIMDRVHHTERIYHIFRHGGSNDITFVDAPNQGWVRYSRQDIPEPTVMFHQCKDGSLIDLLQEEANLVNV